MGCAQRVSWQGVLVAVGHEIQGPVVVLESRYPAVPILLGELSKFLSSCAIITPLDGFTARRS